MFNLKALAYVTALIALPCLASGGSKPKAEDQASDDSPLTAESPRMLDMQAILELSAQSGSEAQHLKRIDSLLKSSTVGKVSSVTEISDQFARNHDPINEYVEANSNDPVAKLDKQIIEAEENNDENSCFSKRRAAEKQYDRAIKRLESDGETGALSVIKIYLDSLCDEATMAKAYEKISAQAKTINSSAEEGKSNVLTSHKDIVKPEFLRALWLAPIEIYDDYKTMDVSLCKKIIRPLSLLKILMPQISGKNAAEWGLTPKVFKSYAGLIKGLDIAYEGGYSSCQEALVLAAGLFSDIQITNHHGFHNSTCESEPKKESVSLSSGGDDYFVNLTVYRVTSMSRTLFMTSIECNTMVNGFIKPEID